MKKYFGIVKNGYLRLCIAITVAIASWILFFFNAEFSEEFTGWVSIEFNGEIKDENFKDNLLASLQEKDFPKLQVNVDQEEETVKLKINWSLDSDEKVNELSLAIPAYLIDNGIITSADDIVSQAVIWPSVWDYMRSTAVKALIFWLIAMMIYMIFSFWGIRKYVAPGILASVVLLSSVLSISLPAGAYWLWMWLDSTIQIDTVFIIAILTIIGYWINDVIIIFDRARENIMKQSKKEFSYKDIAPVYTIVFLENSPSAFKEYKDVFVHKFSTVSDTGLKMNMVSGKHLEDLLEHLYQQCLFFVQCLYLEQELFKDLHSQFEYEL